MSCALVMTAEDLELHDRLGAVLPQLAYQRPLSEAASRGDLDLAFIQRESEMPRTWWKLGNMPLVAVVTDTVGKPAGPTTWRSTVPLIAWAEIAILHRTGAPAGHYRLAAELAKTHLRVLLVEAPAGTFDAWLALLEMMAGLAVEVLR